MSPKSSTLLALCGVLLAGIPLPYLTAARREAPAVEQQDAATTRPTYATLHWSGRAISLRLLHAGQELAHLGKAELANAPCELELTLPAGQRLALEVEARWPEGSPAQAVTLTLEPEGQSTRTCTQWSEPGTSTLHSLFSFSW